MLAKSSDHLTHSHSPTPDPSKLILSVDNSTHDNALNNAYDDKEHIGTMLNFSRKGSDSDGNINEVLYFPMEEVNMKEDDGLKDLSEGFN